GGVLEGAVLLGRLPDSGEGLLVEFGGPARENNLGGNVRCDLGVRADDGAGLVRVRGRVRQGLVDGGDERVDEVGVLLFGLFAGEVGGDLQVGVGLGEGVEQDAAALGLDGGDEGFAGPGGVDEAGGELGG